MVGAQPFCSTEINRFLNNMNENSVGHGVCSPAHNRFDSIRDDSVYNSIGSGPPPSQWSRSGAASSSLKSRLQNKVHGLTSEQLSFSVDPRAKFNGGDMGGIINYDYERDYILEAIMQDKTIQAEKARKKSFDLRRTTKAHQGNVNAAKKRMEKIRENELLALQPPKKHQAGTVPEYYPMTKVNKMLKEGETWGAEADRAAEAGEKESGI